MANKNEIIISTEEYKELISKGVPNENEKWFKNKLEEFLLDYFKIDGTSLEIKDNWKFCDDFETWLKLIDRETKKTSYTLIKEFRGAFVAWWWQLFAKLVGADLKEDYDL